MLESVIKYWITERENNDEEIDRVERVIIEMIENKVSHEDQIDYWYNLRNRTDKCNDEIIKINNER